MKICIDGDLLLVCYNDTVQVLLFHFRDPNTNCSPLALGILTALNYVDNVKEYNSNFNKNCCDMIRLDTFAGDNEWDGTQKQQKIDENATNILN